jgi:hypothetical protein
MTHVEHEARGGNMRDAERGRDRPLDTGAATAALAAYLARKGLKHSRQRERIVQTFFGLPGHVTVGKTIRA